MNKSKFPCVESYYFKIALRKYYIGVLLLLGIVTNCSPLISTYDQTAYSKVTGLKIDALDLMDKASEKFADHQNDVKVVQLEMLKAIEYDKHRIHNEITNKMYEVLNKPDGHLFGGFISRWKSMTKLDTAFISDQKKIIGSSFDQIAELESKKIKSPDKSN